MKSIRNFKPYNIKFIFILMMTSYPLISRAEMLIVDGIDQSYNGKYAQFKEYQDFLIQAPRLRQEALNYVRERLGLNVIGSDHIVVTFAEGGTGFKTSSKKVDGRRVHRIIVYLEPLILGVFDNKKSVTHEMIHAVMRERMGKSYWDLPKWLVEGIAVWGSDELMKSSEILISFRLLKNENPKILVNGLESLPHTHDDYFEDALLFEYIKQEFGEDAVRNLLSSIMNGQNYKLAFKKQSGNDWEVLTKKAEQFSIEFIDSLLREGNYEMYRQADEDYQNKNSECVDKLNNFIQLNPHSFLVPNAYYRIARCQLSLRQYEKAIETLQYGMDHYPRHFKANDDAHFRLGFAYYEWGKISEAQKVFQEFLDLQINSAFISTVKDYLQKIGR